MTEEITILSGKGGTGKTSVAAALFALMDDAIVTDCDVDASDLHLLLHPQVRKKHVFEGGWVASIDTAACTSCGLCAETCRFGAIVPFSGGSFRVDTFGCEGCRLCERICPAHAISSRRSNSNCWCVSDTRYGLMVHAQMGPGEENSGKLVTTVRREAREQAKARGSRFILNDGPPGIGCPVIASVTGAQKVLMVVEPSNSGLHDIRRLAGVVGKFGVPAFAVINKSDMNWDVSAKAGEMLDELNIPLLGSIPFDDVFTKAMIAGQTIVEFAPDSEIVEILRRVSDRLIGASVTKSIQA